MKVYFVLVEPKLPENIGAAARAMKTMGFKHLCLVNPGDHLNERARWVAHGSVDILRNATVFSTINEAVDDADLVIGTTVRKRAFKRYYYAGHELISVLKSKIGMLESVAILFGSESSGLSSDQLRRCDIVSTIPMKSDFPSLNLAQAVMVYAYLLSPLVGKDINREEEKADKERLLFLKRCVNQLLERLEIDPSSNVHGRILEQLMGLSEDNLKLVHFIIKRINQKL